MNLGILFGMYFWRPSASEAWVVFLLAGAWGVTDGVWQTQTCSKFYCNAKHLNP